MMLVILFLKKKTAIKDLESFRAQYQLVCKSFRAQYHLVWFLRDRARSEKYKVRTASDSRSDGLGLYS